MTREHLERQGIDNPDIRPDSIDNPDIRPDSIDNPDIRPDSIDTSEIAPQPMSGGLPVVPIAAVAGIVVVAVAAFSFLGGGGGPGATPGPGAASAPAAATGGVTSTAATSSAATTTGAANPATPAEARSATLVISGGVTAIYVLDFGGNVSPTAPLIAGVWTGTVSDSAAGYADLATITLGGPIYTGTRATSEDGIIIAFSASRTDAQGNDLFLHVWTSKAGECEVSMATGPAVTGSFRCSGLTSEDGVTIGAEGTFST